MHHSPEVVRLKAENERLRAALEAIHALDPNTDSDDGYNEWGEAECFGKSQGIALKVLGVSEVEESQ